MRLFSFLLCAGVIAKRGSLTVEGFVNFYHRASPLTSFAPFFFLFNEFFFFFFFFIVHAEEPYQDASSILRSDVLLGGGGCWGKASQPLLDFDCALACFY